jgi:hypothetical protein
VRVPIGLGAAAGAGAVDCAPESGDENGCGDVLDARPGADARAAIGVAGDPSLLFGAEPGARDTAG